MEELAGVRVAFITANEGVERTELESPWRAVEEAGGEPSLISPKHGTATLVDHLSPAGSHPVDFTTAGASAADYDALVLPGGVANPDELRLDRAAVRLARDFFESGKPVAVICHGPWTLIEADVVRGRTMTSWPSLHTDLQNAGAEWVDEETVLCTNGPNAVLSSRKPEDLPAFCTALVELFSVKGERGDRLLDEDLELLDEVDEAGIESFPASDPPAYNA